MPRCPHCREQIDKLYYVERGYCNTDGEAQAPTEIEHFCDKCDGEVNPFSTGGDDSLIE